MAFRSPVRIPPARGGGAMPGFISRARLTCSSNEPRLPWSTTRALENSRSRTSAGIRSARSTNTAPCVSETRKPRHGLIHPNQRVEISLQILDIGLPRARSGSRDRRQAVSAANIHGRAVADGQASSSSFSSMRTRRSEDRRRVPATRAWRLCAHPRLRTSGGGLSVGSQ